MRDRLGELLVDFAIIASLTLSSLVLAGCVGHRFHDKDLRCDTAVRMCTERVR